MYIESLRANPGDSYAQCIQGYLELKKQNLTNSYTVFDFNYTKYPIGYFDEDNIDLLKVGRDTLYDLEGIVANGGLTFSEEYQECSNKFIDALFDRIEYPYVIKGIVKGFSEAAQKRSVPLLSADQNKAFQERLVEKERALETKGKEI